MSTPEGKIKRRVSAAFKRHGHYYFMPVQSGFGKKGLDYFACLYGTFVAAETKARGKKLTDLQKGYKREIEAAGGKVFVIDSMEQVKRLEEYLELLSRLHGARNGCPTRTKAPARRRPGHRGVGQPLP